MEPVVANLHAPPGHLFPGAQPSVMDYGIALLVASTTPSRIPTIASPTFT
jgi:hypothetical protein